MAKHILGVQGGMWTCIAVMEKANAYQIYPRLLALSEVAWSAHASGEWGDFNRRPSPQSRRFQLLVITYFDSTADGKKIGAWQVSGLCGGVPAGKRWKPRPCNRMNSHLASECTWRSLIKIRTGSRSISWPRRRPGRDCRSTSESMAVR